MSQAVGHSQKILYLCDGEDETCSKNLCYKNGGPCRHTHKIVHAVNFSADYLNHFWEMEALPQWMKETEQHLSNRS